MTGELFRLATGKKCDSVGRALAWHSGHLGSVFSSAAH